MDIRPAQQDVRTAYLRGSVAQAIMGIFWLVSAALGTWVSEFFAIAMIGMAVALTFPLTLLTLRLMGRPMGLPGAYVRDGHALHSLYLSLRQVGIWCVSRCIIDRSHCNWTGVSDYLHARWLVYWHRSSAVCSFSTDHSSILETVDRFT